MAGEAAARGWPLPDNLDPVDVVSDLTALGNAIALDLISQASQNIHKSKLTDKPIYYDALTAVDELQADVTAGTWSFVFDLLIQSNNSGIDLAVAMTGGAWTGGIVGPSLPTTDRAAAMTRFDGAVGASTYSLAAGIPAGSNPVPVRYAGSIIVSSPATVGLLAMRNTTGQFQCVVMRGSSMTLRKVA